MGVTLFLALLLAQPSHTVSEAPTISAVEVRLPAGDGADSKLLARVPGLVSVRRGQILSRRAVQRSIENLFATGHFADIIVEGERTPEGISLVFELVPRRSIAEVYVEGHTALSTAEAVGATRLEKTNEFWPERVEQAAEALREAYRRRGYRSVRVDTRVDSVEQGVAVGFLVDEGQPTIVSSVSVVGHPGLALAKILDTLKLRPGDVLDQSRLDEGLERLRDLYRSARHYRARVEQAQLDGGRVVIPVTAGPAYDIVFSGNRHVSDRSLSVVLGYSGEETLDDSLAQRLAQRLTRFYRFRGFHDAVVTPSEVARPGQREAALGFAIEEGAPLRVVETTFSGNASVASSELQEVLSRVIEASAPAPSLDVHAEGDPLALEGRMAPVFAQDLPSPPWVTVLDEPSWAEAAKAMTALYRARGFLKASVKLDHVDVAERQARASFVVEEGPQSSFRSIALKGAPQGFRSDAVDELVAQHGPFSVSQLDQLRQDLARELGRKGYLFATLESSWALDASSRFADCVVTVTSGPQVKVRAILPVGNVRTADEVLLQQARMVEGEPLDAESLFKTQNNLIGLGIFRTVEVEMLSPERPEPLKTVVLKVRERAPYSWDFAPGYFLADGPRFVVDVGASNLGGRAVNLNAHLQLNIVPLSWPVLSRQIDISDLYAWQQVGGRANVSIQSRSVLPANIGVRADAVVERVFRPQFRFNRAAAVPTIDWTTAFEIPRLNWLRPKVSVALQYELEWSQVERTGSSLTTELPTSLLDQERLRFRFGNFALQTVRLSPTLDLRDSSINPHKGLLLQGSAEVTGALSAFDEAGQPVVVNFLKASGLATIYLPLFRNLVFALSARGGRIFPLAPGSSTPPVRRFFLGGATSMRGFNEDQLIAEEFRRQYHSEVGDCRVLAVKAGCTSAARAILADRQVPSQGGELFALFKAELRIPVLSSLDLGIFAETGNLWLDAPATVTLRWIAGAGLRYVSPIGPLALDVGVNLAPDIIINEPAFVVHFNIGVF